MADILRLHNMTFHAYHGVFPEERALGQKFQVDLELQLDLRVSGLSDNLEESIDYVRVYRNVKEVVEKRQCILLEHLAEEIVREILTHFPVEMVTVRVRKPHPPVDAILDSVEVEISRTRGTVSVGKSSCR
ncbi:MAG: dihydroneopterin aldolase [Candidatus Latescibacteria bacterium]|nr:dihydroneopterin aldolase [Candidatus Latescibacterota bacterium]